MLNAFLFFIIAILYASVGFGGGSGYIAVLSFADLPPAELRFIALCCNILVVSGGTYLFFKHGVLSLRKALPFVITSVPAAFWGGSIQLNVFPFFLLLAICLFLAGILMLLQRPKNYDVSSSNFALNAFFGMIIGFVSGLVGIGGGIFLAPLLYMVKWDTPKIIAATASFFILVNSVSGLLGQMTTNDVPVAWAVIIPLLIAVGIGGQIGSRLPIKWLSEIRIKRLTAILVIFASLRMFYKLFIS